MGRHAGYFRSVRALSGCRLKVETSAGARIELDFTSRLGTMRFGALADKELFAAVHTDGNFILFGREGAERVIISADDFLDLLLIDRTRATESE